MKCPHCGKCFDPDPWSRAGAYDCVCYEGHSDAEEEHECDSCHRYLIQADLDAERYRECAHCWLERTGG